MNDWLISGCLPEQVIFWNQHLSRRMQKIFKNLEMGQPTWVKYIIIFYICIT
jgi:hypothetical protein